MTKGQVILVILLSLALWTMISGLVVVILHALALVF
jgi:hypothetical protein